MLPWRQGSSGCLSFNTSKTSTRSVIHHSQPSMANQTQLPTLAFTTMVTMTFLYACNLFHTTSQLHDAPIAVWVSGLFPGAPSQLLLRWTSNGWAKGLYSALHVSSHRPSLPPYHLSCPSMSTINAVIQHHSCSHCIYVVLQESCCYVVHTAYGSTHHEHHPSLKAGIADVHQDRCRRVTAPAIHAGPHKVPPHRRLCDAT